MARRCYAHSLGDCSGSLTREHYLSKNILRLAADENGGVELTGSIPGSLPTLLDKPSSPENLAVAKILCEHHNSCLSPLDTEMGDFVETVRDWNQGLAPQRFDFDGILLTKWLLKFGLGTWIVQHKEPEAIDDFDTLVSILFGDELPGYMGLSLFGLGPPETDIFSTSDPFGGFPVFATSLSNPSTGLSTRHVTIITPPIRLTLYLGSPPDGRHFRPTRCNIERSGLPTLRLTFGWDWSPHPMDEILSFSVDVPPDV